MYYARKAFREQSREVALLQQQAERDIAERRRAQAAKVFVWVDPRQAEDAGGKFGPAVCVGNSSKQPAKIYNDARASGKDHPHAVRILARAWIRVIYRWACSCLYVRISARKPENPDG